MIYVARNVNRKEKVALGIELLVFTVHKVIAQLIGSVPNSSQRHLKQSRYTSIRLVYGRCRSGGAG